MFGEDHARGPFLDSPVRARSRHIALQFGSIRSAFRSRESAHWASWADCPAMVKARHPVVAARIVGNWAGSHQLHALETCRSVLWHWAPLASNFHRGPHWQTEPVRCLHDGMYQPRCGWQREVSLKVEQHFRDTRLLPTMTEPDQALLRSQGGPLAATPVHQLPHRQVVPD